MSAKTGILEVSLPHCPRCWASHDPIAFTPFIRPSEMTHFAVCPTTGEPIVCDMRQITRAKPENLPQTILVERRCHCGGLITGSGTLCEMFLEAMGRES